MPLVRAQLCARILKSLPLKAGGISLQLAGVVLIYVLYAYFIITRRYNRILPRAIGGVQEVTYKTVASSLSKFSLAVT